MPPLFLEKNKRVALHLIKQEFVKLSDENRRLTLHVSCILDAHALTGMPDWIQNAYTLMVRIANKSKKNVFEEAIHNCFVEMYGTEKTKTRLFPIINEANLLKFTMERTGKDDETVAVKLLFQISFAARKEIYDWCYDTKKATFYAQFEESQQELYNPGNEDDDESDDSDEEEEEEATQDALPLEDEDELSAQQKRKNAREATAAAARAANDPKTIADAKRKLSLIN